MAFFKSGRPFSLFQSTDCSSGIFLLLPHFTPTCCYLLMWRIINFLQTLIHSYHLCISLRFQLVSFPVSMESLIMNALHKSSTGMEAVLHSTILQWRCMYVLVWIWLYRSLPKELVPQQKWNCPLCPAPHIWLCCSDMYPSSIVLCENSSHASGNNYEDSLLPKILNCRIGDSKLSWTLLEEDLYNKMSDIKWKKSILMLINLSFLKGQWTRVFGFLFWLIHP